MSTAVARGRVERFNQAERRRATATMRTARGLPREKFDDLSPYDHYNRCGVVGGRVGDLPIVLDQTVEAGTMVVESDHVRMNEWDVCSLVAAGVVRDWDEVLALSATPGTKALPPERRIPDDVVGKHWRKCMTLIEETDVSPRAARARAKRLLAEQERLEGLLAETRAAIGLAMATPGSITARS